MKERRYWFLSFWVEIIKQKNFFKVGKKKMNEIKILNNR